MYYNYDTTKIINVLLFVIQSLGGKTEVVRLLRIVCQADIYHLSRYGSLITGDTYIALKNGPVSFYSFLIYQKLLTNDNRISFELNVHEYFTIEGDFISSLAVYDGSYLSNSEVDCIFEKIREYKKVNIERISDDILNEHWAGMQMHNEIPINVLAAIGNATPGMTSYISATNKLRSHYKIDESLKQDKNSLDSIIYSLSIGCILTDISAKGELHTYIVAGMSVKRCALVQVFSVSTVNTEDVGYDVSYNLRRLEGVYDFFQDKMLVDCSKVYVIKYNKLSARMNVNPGALIGKLEDEDIHRLIDAVFASSTVASRLRDEFVVS